jgi:hypothetical protein
MVVRFYVQIIFSDNLRANPLFCNGVFLDSTGGDHE